MIAGRFVFDDDKLLFDFCKGSLINNLSPEEIEAFADALHRRSEHYHNVARSIHKKEQKRLQREKDESENRRLKFGKLLSYDEFKEQLKYF